MSKPAPRAPETTPALAALPTTTFKELGWREDAPQREARLRASLPAQQERFRELLAAIAG